MAQPNAQLMKNGANAKLGPNASAPVKKYVETACQAISGAIGAWQMGAMFAGIKINGPVAVGGPGCLTGPKLESAVKTALPQTNDWERKMSQAVASAVSSAWDSYEKSVIVPGLPWYPAFGAVASPIALPMPNVPTPFSSLPQSNMMVIQQAILSGIKAKAGTLDAATVVAEAIAAGFGMMFPPWVASIIVKGVLGKGPVPSFAPPAIPVGPVVMGDNIAQPGHLAP